MGKRHVLFTQYLRPDGRRHAVSIERDGDIATKAASVRTAGGRFEIEVLGDGTISMTIERDNADGEVDILSAQLCANGTAVPETVDVLVEEAYRALHR